MNNMPLEISQSLFVIIFYKLYKPVGRKNFEAGANREPLNVWSVTKCECCIVTDVRNAWNA
jgi:hypothetical protein